MSEQERPRTDWVRDLEKWVSGSDETLANFRWRVNEALEAARTEGRQQAVREKLDVETLAKWLRGAYGHAFPRVDWEADAAEILDLFASSPDEWQR